MQHATMADSSQRLVLGVVLAACSPASVVDDIDACDESACLSSSEGGEPPTSDVLPGESSEGGESGQGETSGPASSTGLPCAVLDVLRRECHECHGSPPSFGAPMSLLDYDDLQLPAFGDPTRAVYEVVAERLVDEAAMMPPGGDIDASDRDVLLDWIAADAPEDPDSQCGDAPPDDGPDVGPDALPCEPDTTFLAHDPLDPSKPYHVPSLGADDLYTCFAFNSPFAPGEQGTAWAPIIDDERVVHHIVFYSTIGPQLENGVYPCSVMEQVINRFVAIWAPGGGNLVMPEEAGLDLSAPGYVMQVHYNNAAHHEDALDRSGIAMCTTDTPREHKAGSLTLGTIGIAIPPGAEDWPIYGRCGVERTLLWPEEVKVAFSAPHMHQLGRSFDTKALRLDASGTITEHTLVDVPQFDFNHHQGYVQDPPFVIKRGDELRTKCVYDNDHPFPVLFGEGTNDEMCLNFMLVYPIDGILEQNCGVVL
jgi:hypothetical protein